MEARVEAEALLENVGMLWTTKSLALDECRGTMNVGNAGKGGTYMPHTRFSGEEIARRGEELYEQSLRASVETAENIGKIIAIDIETGDYEIGDDVIATGRRLLRKHPDAATWTKRIGYNAVYALGGTLTRTSE